MGLGPNQGFYDFTLWDLALVDLQRLHLGPNLAPIVHHDVKVRWHRVFEIDVRCATTEAFISYHTLRK